MNACERAKDLLDHGYTETPDTVKVAKKEADQ